MLILCSITAKATQSHMKNMQMNNMEEEQKKGMLKAPHSKTPLRWIYRPTTTANVFRIE